MSPLLVVGVLIGSLIATLLAFAPLISGGAALRARHKAKQRQAALSLAPAGVALVLEY